MEKLGYLDKYKGSCPNAEEVQKRSMLFKTNYRSIDEAKHYVDILKKSLETYK